MSSRIEEEAQRDPQIKFNFVLRSEGFAGPKIKGRRSKSPQPPFAKGGQEGGRKQDLPAEALA